MKKIIVFAILILAFNAHAGSGEWTKSSWQKVNGVNDVGDISADSLTVSGPIDYNSDATRIFAIEGDSLSEWPGYGKWVPTLEELNGAVAGYTFTNWSEGGTTVGDMLVDYSIEIAPLAPSKDADSATFILWGGTNDAPLGRTPTEVYTDLKAIWALAKADKFKVTAFTITPRADGPYFGEDTTAIAIDDCTGTTFGVTAHDMVQNQRIQSTFSDCNLLQDETYYVKTVIGPNDIEISLTVGGTAINGGGLIGAGDTKLRKLTYIEWIDQYNALILSDKTLYDYLARPDIWFPDATDTDYYAVDELHLTVDSSEILATQINHTLSQQSHIKIVAGTSGDRTLSGYKYYLSFGDIITDTTTGADKLIISNNSSFNIQLMGPSGTTNCYGFSTAEDNNDAAICNKTSTGELQLRTGGSNSLRINASGQVGIGTVPDELLHIDQGTGFGAIKADGSTGGCLMIRDTDDAGWSKGKLLNGVITWSIDADGVCD